MNGTLGSGYSRGHSLALVATASLAGSVLGIAPISFVRSVAAPPSQPASLDAGIVSQIGLILGYSTYNEAGLVMMDRGEREIAYAISYLSQNNRN